MAMGLNWIPVPLPFVGGVDTKVDPLQIAPTKLTTLENCTFITPRSLRTRQGYTTLTKSIAGGGAIGNGQAAFAYKDELLIADTARLYSFERATPAWVNKGPLVSTLPTQQPILRDAYGQTQQDGATHPSGLHAAAWEDTQGGVFYSVLDGATGQPVVTKALLSATAIKPKVLAIGNFIAVLYVEQNTWCLMLALVPIANPTSLIAGLAITAGSGARSLNQTVPSYDATTITEAVYGQQLYFSFFGTDGNTWICNCSATNPQAPIILNTNILQRGDVIAVFGDPSTGGPVVANYDSVAGGGGLYLTAFYPFPTAQLIAPTPVLTQAAGSLGAGTKAYQLTVLNQAGESTPCAPVTSTLTGGITLTWTAVPGATGYNVYGRTAGGEETMQFVNGLTFTDNGSITPVLPVPPTSNTTLAGTSIRTERVTALGSIISLTGIGLPGVVPALRLAWTPTLSFANLKVQQITIAGSGYTPGAITTLMRSVGLAGKPFVYSGLVYYVLAHGSGLQNTYFLVDQNANVIARVLPGLGGGPSNRVTLGAPCLPETTQPSTTSWRVVFLVQDLLTVIPSSTQAASYNSILYSQTGVTAYTFELNDLIYSYSRAELANALLIGGGNPITYFGQAPTEQGYHLWPEGVVVAGSTMGGALGQSQNIDAVYWWCITYEWTDNYGQVQISAPSEPVSYTITYTGGTPIQTGSAVLTIPTLRVSSKTGVTINVYRTIANGQVFYRAVQNIVPNPSPATNTPVQNNPLVDTVTFTDVLSDANLQQNPQLYTTGGIIENTASGPLVSLATWQSRIFGIAPDDPLVLWYSKEVIPGAPIEFSEFLTQALDARIVAATAIVGQDASLIVFGASSIFYLTGPGPNSAGNGGSFGLLNQITTDCGCIAPKSIATVSGSTLPGGGGTFFQSAKGIFLLGRDLITVDYVGADVQALVNGNVVTSAQLVAGTNQVRFTLNTGIAVVYDYYMKQWSVFTPLAAADAAVWRANGAYTWLDAKGAAWVETPGQFNDNGQPINWNVVTSWLDPSGLQGFERVREFLILGLYKSPHTLNVGIAYNYDVTIRQQLVIVPPVPGTWGGDPTWGGGGPWGGGDFRPYQWRVLLNTQKIDAMQVTITSSQSNMTPGEGLALSGLTLLVGGKGKLFRLPASATYG